MLETIVSFFDSSRNKRLVQERKTKHIEYRNSGAANRFKPSGDSIFAPVVQAVGKIRRVLSKASRQRIPCTSISSNGQQLKPIGMNRYGNCSSGHEAIKYSL
jgi:hypothetical protein